MIPFLGKGIKGNETALKLALTGGIKESLFEGDTVVEYLLWRLRARCAMAEGGYSEGSSWRNSERQSTHAFSLAEELLRSLALPPMTSLADPTAFLRALALRLSALKKGGEPDADFAGRWLIQFFREGKLGRWTLDGLGRGGEAVDFEEVEGEAVGGLRSYYSTLATTVEGEADPMKERIDTEVDKAIGDFFRRKEKGGEDLSGHQAKKLVKAAQAATRDAKRKAQAPAVVSGRPGGGIQSARRRNYRR